MCTLVPERLRIPFSFPPFFHVPFFATMFVNVSTDVRGSSLASRAAAADKGLGQKERRFSFWEQRIGFVRNGRGEDGCCVNIVRKSRVIASPPQPTHPLSSSFRPLNGERGGRDPLSRLQPSVARKRRLFFLLKNSNRFPRRRRCGEATAASPASSSGASWPPTRTVTGGASSSARETSPTKRSSGISHKRTAENI